MKLIFILLLTLALGGVATAADIDPITYWQEHIELLKYQCTEAMKNSQAELQKALEAKKAADEKAAKQETKKMESK